MPTTHPLLLIRGDDPIVNISVTVNGAPYPLTDQRVEIVVKSRPEDDDDDALYTLSTEGGSPAIEITGVDEGTAVADFTDRLETAGGFWYRAYVADVGDADTHRHTFARGNLTVRHA